MSNQFMLQAATLGLKELEKKIKSPDFIPNQFKIKVFDKESTNNENEYGVGWALGTICDFLRAILNVPQLDMILIEVRRKTFSSLLKISLFLRMWKAICTCI